MGNCRRNCNLGRLIEPVDVVGKDKIGNHIRNYQDSPVRKKNYVPGNKTGKNFQKSLDDPIVCDNKRSYFRHDYLSLGKRGSSDFIFGPLNCFSIFTAVSGRKGAR